jgi:HD-like signal output (HDOD) protein
MTGQEDIQGKVLFYMAEGYMAPPDVEDLADAGIQMFRGTDEAEALKLVGKHNVDIALVDLDESEERGSEFFKKVKKKFPTTNRVALSETSQRRDVIQLLLKGIITSYFEKPGGFETLLTSFLHILYARKTLRNQKLLKLLESVDSLPTFPKVYQEFMDALDNDLSIKEISKIIEKDVSIATQVLRIANSDFFRAGRIGSIERAGIYLGMDTIKNIVFAVSLSQIKKLTSTQKKYLEKIIYHSVQVNSNFKKMYESQTGNQISDQYATIGITHDIGKIIMLQFLPQRFEKIMKYQKANPEVGFYRSELELGYKEQTHAEIGAYFLNLWNFPEASVYTALFHHSTEDFSEPYKELLDIFTIVNEVAYTGEQGEGL